MAASGSSTSIEVTLCCPPGPTKHPHEAPNPPGNTHGHAMDPTLDTHDGHTEKQGEDTGWVCSAGVEKGQDPSSAFRVSATPQASLLLVLWLELFPRHRRILPDPEGDSGLEQ